MSSKEGGKEGGKEGRSRFFLGRSSGKKASKPTASVEMAVDTSTKARPSRNASTWVASTRTAAASRSDSASRYARGASPAAAAAAAAAAPPPRSAPTSASMWTPSTGQLRSGHIEVDTLFGSGTPLVDPAHMVVNAMNAPNNSTMQCGCDNIDCPFCNLMLSVQMKDATY